jgi:hypothetical protein
LVIDIANGLGTQDVPGTPGNALEVDVDTLQGSVGAGGVHLVDEDDLRVSTLTSGGAVDLETKTAGRDLVLESIEAAGQVVTLESAGSVLDGDAPNAEGRDVLAATLSIISATGLGTATNALETQIDTLQATVGADGLYLAETDGLTVRTVTSDGTVEIRAAGAGAVLAVEFVQATGQRVLLDSAGTIIDGDPGASDAVDIVAGSLELVASAGVGTAASRIETDIDELRAKTGTGGLALQEVDKVRVVSTEGAGGVDLLVPQGTFVADTPQIFASPVKVQSASVEVTAPLTGASIEVSPPRVDPTVPNARPLPLVVGTPVKVIEQPPAQGIFVDRAEVGRLRFDDIFFGGAQSKQEVWLLTDPADPADRLVFPGRLTVDTSSSDGVTRLAGRIEGVGMAIQGSGHTTYLDGADILHTDNVTIDDALVVNDDSIIEVADGNALTTEVLTIQGDITVKAGKTLQLLADVIRLAPHSTLQQARITLEAGATLVLGATTLTVNQAVIFDSDGGFVQLRGAPSSVKAPASSVGGAGLVPVADFVPLPFEPSAAVLDSRIAWLAADLDPDAGLARLTLGDDAAAARLLTPSPWTSLQANGTELVLRGTTVHLGADAGGAAWVFPAETVLRAATGHLHLHVDLEAHAGLSVATQQGNVVMSAGTVIDARGPVALSAPGAVTVSRVVSGERIDVVSTGQEIRATGVVTGGVHLWAPSVSIHGEGLALPLVDPALVPVADAERVQVSGTAGSAFEGRGGDGRIVYRMASAGAVREQLRMVDDGADRVLVAQADLVRSAGDIGRGQPVSAVYQRPLGALPDGFVSALATGGSAAARYLGEPVRTTAVGSLNSSTSAAGSGLALSDLAYGLGGVEGDFTTALGGNWGDPGAPLLRSTGQVLADPLWSIDHWHGRY